VNVNVLRLPSVPPALVLAAIAAIAAIAAVGTPRVSGTPTIVVLGMVGRIEVA